MAVVLEEIVESVEQWLKLAKKPKPYVNPDLDPVLLIPGIAGSILNAVDEKGKEERIWVRIFGADHEFRSKLWSQFDPSTGRTVSLDPKTTICVPEERHGLYAIDVLDPDLIVGRECVCYYHDMIVEMLKWGFQEGSTLFGFGYDFRQSNRLPETMDRFVAKLESAYNASGGKKLNIVTHSMGGLLVKCFMCLHSDIFEKYVKNWIAIAAPFRGAPGYITTSLLNGMSFVEGWEQNFFISKWSMQQLLIECPSIYELMACPNFDWQSTPLLEMWRDKLDADSKSRIMLESYEPTEALSILQEALSSNMEILSPSSIEAEDEDGWSLFYSNSVSMAVQVDDEKTVGQEAFARIAPACPATADIITVHNLFDVLTSSSGGRLHFLIYDKYLGSLDKVIKNAKQLSGPLLSSNLQLAEGEVIIEVDGTIPTQPVLQHIGISGWPGKLTLTNYALYFESGVGIYDKPVRYDLTKDLKQVVKPELTGPLGTRLFDKAVMYKSATVAEPVYFEFPEFKYNSRRDYWLEIILEILHAHRFIKKYRLKETQQIEALAKAILGIFRYHAVREAVRIFPTHYRTLLDYNLAEKLPRGDKILEILANRMKLLTARKPKHDAVGSALDHVKRKPSLSPLSLMTLTGFGFMLPRWEDAADEAPQVVVGDVCVGETNPLEIAVEQLKCDASKTEAAQETVDKAKLEGIDINIAVMKDLLFPMVELVKRLQFLASWSDPYKSTTFFILINYTIYRDWVKYLLPCTFVSLAAVMLWRKHRNKGKPLEVFRVAPPPSKNAVELLVTLQEAISQFEALVQDGNIVLLKLRALLFAALPQASEKVAILLLIMAAVFVFVPLKVLILLILLEAYTREMPLRRDSNDKWVRRVREWWFRIPAAPVQLIKEEDSKKRK